MSTLTALSGAALVSTPATLAAETPNAETAADDPHVQRALQQQRALARANATAEQLRRQLRHERRMHTRRVARVRRAALARPAVTHALALGAAAYGVPVARLRSVAACESGLRPTAGNGRYQGLFQFGSRLWNATPYRSFARTDAYAASFAAAWAFSRGMARHWPICGR